MSERSAHWNILRIIHSGQDMEIAEVSFDGWFDKEYVVHGYDGILLGHKMK